MPEIQVNAALVARCGLYCAACPSFQKQKCQGCAQNTQATWCKVRACCADKQIQTCADCQEFDDPRACQKFNNVISRVVGWFYDSDRAACIAQVKELGLEGHARAMAELGRQTISRTPAPRPQAKP